MIELPLLRPLRAGAVLPASALRAFARSIAFCARVGGALPSGVSSKRGSGPPTVNLRARLPGQFGHLLTNTLQKRLQQTASVNHRHDQNAIRLEVVNQSIAVNETLA